MIRPPAAAVVDANGKIRMLIGPREPHIEVTEEQVQRPSILARLLMSALREIASLVRRPAPRRIDHEDVVVNGDGVTKYYFPHGFSGRVRWWVTDCLTSNGALRRDASTTNDVLVLVSGTAGTVTVRIEEVAG